MTGRELLAEHVARFNESVRARDFGELLELFTDDAELAFEGVAVGPLAGKDAIAAAYREQPPDDEIRILDVADDGGRVVAGYAWLAAPDRRAGEMRIDHDGRRIRRLVVTFE